MPRQDIDAAIEQASKWLDIDGVEGVAEGESGGRPCILVFASVAPETLSATIPEEFMGYPVVLEASGPISAL